jgi:2-polyprenyl-6-methoxyphenol hydroxylase-like FAD-dependent oxidoreductase
LKRLGFDPLVFEARPLNALQQGVFLGLTPNGLNVLKDMIDVERLKDDYTPGKMVFFNARNKPIGMLDTVHQRDAYGAETMQVKRWKISELLREQAIREGVVIRYGCKLTALQETDRGVVTRFENGETHEADLLIACDGAHSVGRSLLFPGFPKPRYTRQLSTGAMVSCQGFSVPFGQINMVFGRRAFFAYAASNNNEIWWFNNFYREDEPTRHELQTTLQQEIKDQLLTIHRDDPEPIRAIIEQTDSIFAYPIYEMPEMPRWFSKRVCLIGDAAHATAPHIGQGASLALEDTVVLAHCLQRQEESEDAFRMFQQLRQPRVDRLIKSARKVGNSKSAPNAVATFFRDLLLRHFIQFEVRKLHWVYGYKPEVNANR